MTRGDWEGLPKCLAPSGPESSATEHQDDTALGVLFQVPEGLSWVLLRLVHPTAGLAGARGPALATAARWTGGRSRF